MNACHPVPARPVRLPGWQHRLQALVLARQDAPFNWGSNDCLAWAADVAQALHGQDTLHQARAAEHPRSNARQAWRELRQRGGPVAALCSGLRAAGIAALPVGRAGLGDLLLMPCRPRWPALALCNGEVALLPGPTGLVQQPAWLALLAWEL